MKMTQQSMGQQGFSLVELIVALSILAVALFALAGMQSIATKKTAISHKISSATSIAQEVMEDLMARDPADASLNSSGAYTYDLDPNTPATTITVQGAGTFSATYTTAINTPASGTTWIVVTVTGSGIQPVALSGYKRVV